MTDKKKPKQEVKEETLFKRLSTVDVTGKIQKKNGMSYLSWAWAWGVLKEHCPEASYEKHLFTYGDPIHHTLPYMVDKQGFAYVMVTLKTQEDSVTEVYPVLNYNNKALQSPDGFAVNTALQRCLTKCIAYLGLGHHIYAGEDLPPSESDADVVVEEKPSAKVDTGKEIVAEANKSEIVQEAKKQFGEQAKVSVVVDKANQNVYDGDGGLMFGYNEETRTFVMDENYDVNNQIDLVTEVVGRILPDFDLETITSFFNSNKKVFQDLGKRSETKWTELPFMSVIGKRNAELKGD